MDQIPKLGCFFFYIVLLGVSLRNSAGHEHPRRHHHSYRRGQYFDSRSTDWNSMVHPSTGDETHTSSRETSEEGEEEKPDNWANDILYTQTFDSEGHAYHSKTAVKDSKKDLKKPPKGTILTSSTAFVNETVNKGSITYSGQTIYDENNVFETSDFAKSSDVHTGSTDSQEPIPAATRTRDQELGQNNFLSAPRWTLKYQGITTEQALNNTKTNVTASVGGNAFLPCKVGHLGDRQLLYNFQISWIRRRDWHVLTSGKILYTHDERFSVLHEPGSQDWTLHIKWVDMKDTGTYECQVSTGTGIISLFVKLKVVIPEAFIPGDGQYHVNRGSSIALNCYIKNSPAPPQYILWHHNGQLLNFLRNRPDVVISDDLNRNKNHFFFGSKTTVESGATDTVESSEKLSVSRLRVDFADDLHSGNYTCSAPNTEPASTLVFITEGDKTAAVQRIDSGSALASQAHFLRPDLLFMVLILLS